MRLIIGFRNGLGVDEAHYVLYGRNFDLSYFDHPPLVGWTHFLFQAVLPHVDGVARLPALLLSVVTSYLIYRFLVRRDFSNWVSLATVVLVNLTLLFNALALMLLPDSLIVPLAFLIIEAVEQIDQTDYRVASFSQKAKGWVILGICLGLAGLAKYTAVLFVPGLAFYFLRPSRIKKVFSVQFLLGVLLALLVASPVLIWNMRHQFISFSYQSGHVFNFRDLSFTYFAQSWLGQLVVWGVVLPPLVVLYLSSVGRKAWSDLAVVVAFTNLIFFGFISFSQVLLPHWPAIIFVFLLPLGVAHALSTWSRKRALMIGIVPAVLIVPILLELGFQFLPGNMTALLYRDVRQWDQIMLKAVSFLPELPAGQAQGLAVYNWTLGSRAIYYAPKGVSVFVLDRVNRQFDFWSPESPLGYNLILAIEEEKAEETLTKISCESLEKVGNRIGFEKESRIHSFAYYRCLKYKGLTHEN